MNIRHIGAAGRATSTRVLWVIGLVAGLTIGAIVAIGVVDLQRVAVIEGKE